MGVQAGARRILGPALPTCIAAVLAFSLNTAAASSCRGTPGAGSIAGAVQLPLQGTHFTAYSLEAARAGRTYVHALVRDIVLDAYMGTSRVYPELQFVYGETGLQHGGPMSPHRTHQNGLSVDFMVPVRDPQGRPATLPRSAANRYGYGVEFDGAGHAGALRIDFEALAEHLLQLDQAAHRRGAGLALVILDPALVRHLLATSRGPRVRSLPFMQGKPWIRHDEHYHVDFAIRCVP